MRKKLFTNPEFRARKRKVHALQGGKWKSRNGQKGRGAHSWPLEIRNWRRIQPRKEVVRQIFRIKKD